MGTINVDCINGQDSIKFVLKGRIDATNAYSFSDAVRSAVGEASEKEVVFDCGGLEYISSMGLRVLLGIRKRRSKPVKLANVSGEVLSILNITGFTQLFDVSGGNEQ